MQTKEAIVNSHVIRKEDGKKFDLLGAHLIWKARGDVTNGTFTVAVQTLAPKEVIPKHRHPYPEVFYILSGEFEFTLYGNGSSEQKMVRAGDTVIIAPNEYHSSTNVSHADATLLDIASFTHQRFFDAIQSDAEHWGELTEAEAMGRVGQIGMQHTLEFFMP